MLHRLSVQLCQASGFEPHIVFTDHRLENLLEMVINGMGVALLMRKLAEYTAQSKAAIVGIEPTVITRLDLCYLKKCEPSLVSKQFIAITKTMRSTTLGAKPA